MQIENRHLLYYLALRKRYMHFLQKFMSSFWQKNIYFFIVDYSFFEICTTKMLDFVKSWLKPFSDNKDYWKVDIKTREKYQNSFIFYNPKLTKIYLVNVESIRDAKIYQSLSYFTCLVPSHVDTGVYHFYIWYCPIV